MIAAALLALWLPMWLPIAWAGDDEDDLHENTISGNQGPEKKDAPVDAPELTPEGGENLAYSPLSIKAAEVLHIDVVFADRCRKAIDLIYARKYKEAKKELDKLTVEYPTTGIGPSGMAVIYQGLMFENFDFRYERQYRTAHTAALVQIAEGQRAPGNEAIEFFLQAGMFGLEGIHQMRHGEYLSALSHGLDAVSAVSKCKEAAPDFVDAELGDGMFLYWRTVLARSSPLIPDGDDDREAGKLLMKRVEKDAVFMGPAATLGLTYAYIEERDLRNALARTMYGRKKYPDNVINNMTAGRVLTSMRRYDDAVHMYQEVLRTAPDNQRAHYHLGVVYGRQSKFADAEASFKTYIGYPEVTPDYRGQAWYRLGLLYARQERTTEAKAAYAAAVATSQNDAAKKALANLP